MDSRLIKLVLLTALACSLALMGAVSISADEPINSNHHKGKGYERYDERDEGLGGASGQIAAWLLGIANFPIGLSILLKTSSKLLSQNNNLKKTIDRINHQQKIYLMRLHYWLNPIAAIAAILHFFFAKCETTVMPEIGLAAMLLVCILGIMLTFKWSPTSIRKVIFQFHTSSIALFAIIAILFIGHSMVD
jgi:hypothetical protein